MASDICILCWKKDATEWFVSGKVRVCRGCDYELKRVLNFIAYYGYGIFPLDEDHVSPKPPKPPKKPAKGSPIHAAELEEAKERGAERQAGLDDIMESTPTAS